MLQRSVRFLPKNKIQAKERTINFTVFYLGIALTSPAFWVNLNYQMCSYS